MGRKKKLEHQREKPLVWRDEELSEIIPEDFFKLSERRQRFVLFYVETGRLKASVEAAGFETINPVGYGRALINQVSVRRVLEQIKSRLIIKHAMKAAEVHEEMTNAALADVVDVLDAARGGRLDQLPPEVTRNIKKLKFSDKTGELTEIEMRDSLKALDQLARVNGMYSDNEGGGESLLLEMVKKMAQERRNALDAEYTVVK